MTGKELWDSVVKSTVQSTIIDDDKGREKQRMEGAANRIAMLKDEYGELVRQQMATMFEGQDTMKVMAPYIKCAQNIYKAIISRLSRIYKTPPARSFVGPDGKPVSNADNIKALYDQAQVNRKLKYANLLSNALNDIFLMPVIRDGKLTIDILTPDVVRVITDENDPTKMAELRISREQWDAVKKEKVKYWVVWTDESHYWLVERGKDELVPQAIPENPDMVNPFGVIPAIDVHRYATECSFWDENSGSDIYDANIVVAIRNAMLDYAAVWQCFKQVTLTGADKAPAPGTVLGPDRILWSDHPGATWSTLDLHANFDIIRGDLEALVAAVARNYGVSLDQFNSPDQKSGLAKKIDNQILLDNLEDQVEIWRDAEARLWEMIKIVCEVEGVGKFDADLSIKFADLNMDTSKEALENDEKRMALGIDHPADVYMKYHYTVTDRDEAEKAMTENKAAYNAGVPSPLKRGVLSAIINKEPDEDADAVA